MRLLLLAAVLALLGACSATEELLAGKKVDYKSAGKLPPLDVPPDLTAPARDNRYTVPETGKSAATLSGYQTERAQSRPGAGTVLPETEGVRVARDGSQRWLVVNMPPEKLWPVVKQFWQESGFLLRQELPEAGIMETEWAENRAKIPEGWLRRTLGGVFEDMHSTAERDKYRTRLERAPDGGSEVYISHRGMVELYVTEARALTQWQPRPPEPELEAEFLRRLMVRLGTPEEKAAVLVSTAAQPAQRAALKKGLDGEELLDVFEPFDRAWRRIGLALDRVGFTVEDRDRQKGLFFVRYADPESEMERKSREKSAFSWLAFWRGDGPKVKTEQFRVAVTTLADNSRVQVLDKNGAVDATATSRRILSLLYEQLR